MKIEFEAYDADGFIKACIFSKLLMASDGRAKRLSSLTSAQIIDISELILELLKEYEVKEDK